MNTSRTAYYVDQTQVPLLSSYVYFQFNFAARYLIVINDDRSGTNQVIMSFDGTTKHGQVNATESLAMDEIDAAGIYLKYANGAPDFRMMARPE